MIGHEEMNFNLDIFSKPKVQKILVIFGAVACTILVVCFVFLVKSRFLKKPAILPTHTTVIKMLVGPDGNFVSEIDCKVSLEINRGEVLCDDTIGIGHFGTVYGGIYKNVKVAIKEIKPEMTSKEAFLQEAFIMSRLKHPNLVSLQGICSSHEPFLIISEFMANGNLLDYLRQRNHRVSAQDPEGYQVPRILSQTDLWTMAEQVAKGMVYLESQNLIHRDLAARNVLVSEDNNLKISDFGLSRIVEDCKGSVYYARARLNLPVRWTAPEALSARKKFSVKSDVWSFGIFLYEVMTLGSKPYDGMSVYEVITNVCDNYVMPQPMDCPDRAYKLMTDCWASDPQDRPNFTSIHERCVTALIVKDDYENSPPDNLEIAGPWLMYNVV